MQFSFTSLDFFIYIFHQHSQRFLKIAWSWFTLRFCAFFKRHSAWGVRRSWKEKKTRVKCNFHRTKKETAWEAETSAGLLKRFTSDNEREIESHVCMRNSTRPLKQSFCLTFCLRGASRARLSRGPLYLYVLWLEIMHNGVLVKEEEEDDEAHRTLKAERKELNSSTLVSTLSCNLSPDNRKAKTRKNRQTSIFCFCDFSSSCPFFNVDEEKKK